LSIFGEEIWQLIYGKGRNTYRILFTVIEDKVQVLFVRHSAQKPLLPEDDK
jgi:hypothetical protein